MSEMGTVLELWAWVLGLWAWVWGVMWRVWGVLGDFQGTVGTGRKSACVEFHRTSPFLASLVRRYLSLIRAQVGGTVGTVGTVRVRIRARHACVLGEGRPLNNGTGFG
jgi:hypothetical protein